MDKTIAADEETEILENKSSFPASENLSVEKLAEEIESKLNLSNNSQHVASGYCIFIIPGKFSYENLAPYRPRYAIIGPLAYYNHLSAHQEDEKWRYLNSFLLRAKHGTQLRDFIALIKKSLEEIRGCYEKIYYRYWDNSAGIARQDKRGSESDSSLLIEMILVDAGFILELFLRAYSKEWRVENDLIFAKSGTIHDLKRDLMLLENQLPFFLLRDMYKLAFTGNPYFPSFLHLTCHFFSHYYNQSISIQDMLSTSSPHAEYRSKLEEAKHFTDLIRTFQLPYSFQKHHCINNEESQYLYSAVLLREAGVKFKVILSRCLFDIEFDQNNGELKIPLLKVDDSAESFFANLMVWEQCYYPNDTYVCDYILLMAYLIKSVEDVNLLVRRRIIINQLGSPKAMVTMFNNLCKYIKVAKNRYSGLFMKLNAYNTVRHHSWIAILKIQYFSTLWKGVATIAAVVLLVLTMIQTICAVISL